MQPPTTADSEPAGCEETPHSDRSEARSRSRLILIGASIRAAAQSARRAGFRVIGLDLFGDTDTLAACDLHCCLHKLAESRKKLAPFSNATLIQTGGLGSLGPAVDDLLADFRFLGLPPLQQTKLRTTAFLYELATECAVAFPATTLELPQTSGIDHRGWLRKEIKACGGLGTRWAHANDVRAHANDVANPGVRFQKWIAGRSFGVTFLSNGRDVVMLGACRSLYTRIDPFPFVYAGSYGPVPLNSNVSAALCRLGSELVARTELRGLFNADVIVDSAGVVWLLEVNPRWSASCEVIERAFVRDGRLAEHESLLGLHYDALLNSLSSAAVERLGAKESNKKQLLKRIVFARKRGRYRPIDLGSSAIELCDVPKNGTPIKRGEPIATLVTVIEENNAKQWREFTETYRRLRDGMPR